MWLIKEIVYAQPRKKGIEIGNYTSQIFANIYLNEVDQFIKHKLKVKYYKSNNIWWIGRFLYSKIGS